MTVPLPPFAGDPHSTADGLPPKRTIGSLWRRIVAALIDAIVVGAVATVIALPFFDALSRLGAWGRLVGFCLAIPYYALLNSRIGNGQTLGKRWLRLQVVNAAGETIPFSKSVVRYVVFSAPFFLNHLILPVTRTPRFVIYSISVIVFGLGSITIYLLLFNRKTRQGTHDLAVGSYVAEAEEAGSLHVEPLWKGHWAVLSALIVIELIGGKILEAKIIKLAPFPAMFADARLVEEMKDVQSVGVNDLTWTSRSGNEKKKIYVVNVLWSGKGNEEPDFANHVASQILQRDLQVMDRDILRIVIVRGYDLGIARAQVTNTFEESPPNWKTKLLRIPREAPAPSKL